MPVIHLLWYLEKYPLDSGHANAVVVVDDTPAMAAKIAMSDESGSEFRRTKVGFLALSAIKPKDLVNAVGGALQHAIIMPYMLDADQTEQGATAATWNTQEEWLLPGTPLWVLDSNRGYEGHQQVHAAEAVQEDVVTEPPADNTEPVAPAPTLPSQAKVKKTAKVIPTQGTVAGEGTPSSSKKQAKEKQKESDKPGRSDDNDADGEEEEEDPEQVLETQRKRKRAPAAHFDASPESGKDPPKKKAKTAASASAEFKPPACSGVQPSRGTVASPSGRSAVARDLGSRLAKVAGPEKKLVTIHPSDLPLFAVMWAQSLPHSFSTQMQLYALKGLYIFAELLFPPMILAAVSSQISKSQKKGDFRGKKLIFLVSLAPK